MPPPEPTPTPDDEEGPVEEDTSRESAAERKAMNALTDNVRSRCLVADRRQASRKSKSSALSHKHTYTHTNAHSTQREGPEVDAAKVQAAFSALQAQAKASREAARKRCVFFPFFCAPLTTAARETWPRPPTRSHARATPSFPCAENHSEVALASIKVSEGDVAIVMAAADLARPAAERALRTAGGRLPDALAALARPEAASAAKV